MDFYFGKEQTGNYIEEGKYKKISEKIYNNINRYEIVLDIINKRKNNENILRAKEEQSRILKTEILKRLEYEIKKATIRNYGKINVELEIIIDDLDLEYLIKNSERIIIDLTKNLYKVREIRFNLTTLDKSKSKVIKRIFKKIMYLKETKTSFITFNILDSPYRTTYYNI
mgnify:FL=1|jgi:hypothetical protein